MKALARALGVELFSAIGLMEALWHFTAKYTPQGNVGKFSDQEIADAVYWGRLPDELIAALVNCRWVDEDDEHRLIIHDWHDHADEAVRKLLKRQKLDFVATCRDGSRQNLPALSLPLPSQPLPEPSPSLPALPAASAAVNPSEFGFGPEGEDGEGDGTESCALGGRRGGEGNPEVAMYRLLTDQYRIAPTSARVLAASRALTAQAVEAEAGMVSRQARDPPAVLAVNLAKRAGVELPASRKRVLERTVGPERAAGILRLEELRRAKKS